MRIVALVCARSGSKGIAGKNLRHLAGEPLVARAIRQALAAAGVERVIVSTDGEEIAAIARAAGASVPFMRPADLARDDSPEWLVWRHALEQLRESDGRYPDALLVVPATAPLRSVTDIEACLEEFAKGDVDAVITVTDPHRNPYFNMVQIGRDGNVEPVIRSTSTPMRRQDAPRVFDMTTVAYVARPGFVMTATGLFDGRLRHVVVPAERAIDIDTPLDLRIAEFLASSG